MEVAFAGRLFLFWTRAWTETKQHPHVQGEAAAYLWDRLGHWAQADSNWEEAERCFWVAYDLAGGRYGYCLGTALNFIERAEESLPIAIFTLSFARRTCPEVPASIRDYRGNPPLGLATTIRPPYVGFE